MRIILALAAALLLPPGALRAQDGEQRAMAALAPLDEPTQFLFLSVLDGLYQDGVSTEDVGRILQREEKQSYTHFVYSCPVCTPVVWALEAYRVRPEQFTGTKRPGSTLGTGLPAEVSAALRREDTRARLGAINHLVKGWTERRMRLLRLTDAERAELAARLEAMRQRGMEALERSRREGSASRNAPAYADLDECTVCNGVVGKPMKLPGKTE